MRKSTERLRRPRRSSRSDERSSNVAGSYAVQPSTSDRSVEHPSGVSGHHVTATSSILLGGFGGLPGLRWGHAVPRRLPRPPVSPSSAVARGAAQRCLSDSRLSRLALAAARFLLLAAHDPDLRVRHELTRPGRWGFAARLASDRNRRPRGSGAPGGWEVRIPSFSGARFFRSMTGVPVRRTRRNAQSMKQPRRG